MTTVRACKMFFLVSIASLANNAPGKQPNNFAVLKASRPTQSFAAAQFQFPKSSITITNSRLAPGRVGQEYRQLFNAIGGRIPYSWTVSGSWPEGLKLTDDGMLFGKPKEPGIFSLTVRVTDVTGRQASKTFTLTIAPQAK